jgi:hypothetical protein
VVNTQFPSGLGVEPVRNYFPGTVTLVGAVVYIQDVYPAREEGVAHIHLPVFEGVHIHFPDAVMLVLVVVCVRCVCAERVEAVGHIQLLDEQTKEEGQRIGQLLTLRVEVVHTDLLANVEPVKVHHILYRVTAMAEIL